MSEKQPKSPFRKVIDAIIRLIDYFLRRKKKKK